MKSLQTFLWHLLWLILSLCAILYVRDADTAPLWLDVTTAGVLTLWVFLTAYVWHRPLKDLGIYARMDSGESISDADRVEHATDVWDDLGQTNDGRRYRKKLFGAYLADLGVGDTAVAKSIRRQQEKKNDR